MGTVTEEATLRRLADGEPVPCDLVEIRLDQVGLQTEGWQDLCRRVAGQVAPVLLTVRHAAEGGAWEGPEEQRQALLREAMRYVHAVDTEIQATRSGAQSRRSMRPREMSCSSVRSMISRRRLPRKSLRRSSGTASPRARTW